MLCLNFLFQNERAILEQIKKADEKVFRTTGV